MTGGFTQAHGGRDRGEDTGAAPAEAASGSQQIGVQGTDDLLDEIDGLLENNAEEFVRSYVQKGGQ
ncbi:ubiquitin-like protein Pup [Corynebacterium heidelbergense]|uniref:Prokaryotic ubiquitin-like protein Pup n=1 Tax=Corynebacterium heidelbergense TaxID=2055947 RepID=A0A364V4E8_9CORY|nr:ubiquitin-like protein Pup [Corynebacterium heidelbergense]RAV31498.1 ubiquitin-like protein Pup [Corynebacterium heidelbergense]RAV33379.1 ubiquitin-like protein Pup [Corynebacterium heidelbergense]WCZ36525.1 Prokaryotic ubiquitin-like protein Pup [Corynebacterium heidelbergense]